ncbi:hypothetical protein RND71_033979 [Anisodus tanguticus]|uniref:Uncharacterized protein n=1 Tax=Anisodus tanguticus TaxID=243964 RepID=A0AAE1R9K6_9SOLA|nr:hypothetical protein RND71_033979 [Anisodus tanguticus]
MCVKRTRVITAQPVKDNVIKNKSGQADYAHVAVFNWKNSYPLPQLTSRSGPIDAKMPIPKSSGLWAHIVGHRPEEEEPSKEDGDQIYHIDDEDWTLMTRRIHRKIGPQKDLVKRQTKEKMARKLKVKNPIASSKHEKIEGNYVGQ